MSESFAGEKVLIDNIDIACQAYLDAHKHASLTDPDMETPQGAVMVGWVLGIQTLDPGADESDGLISVVSVGTSCYTALGITATLTRWFGEED